MKVLEFDPMLADVHCGLHAKFWFICLSKRTIALGCAKPGKWDTVKKCKNAGQINVGNIIEWIEKVQNLVSCRWYWHGVKTNFYWFSI